MYKMNNKKVYYNVFVTKKKNNKNSNSIGMMVVLLTHFKHPSIFQRYIDGYIVVSRLTILLRAYYKKKKL